MKTITTLATALALSLAAPGFALANSHHGHGAQKAAGDYTSPMGGQAGMMQGMMRMMMPMMMQMHGQTMGGAMTGVGPEGSMAMMDGAMMLMMMGGDTIGASSPNAVRSAMLARLAEFDADKDGSLSLSEFEVLHAAVTRETTVDRFQHLDADGDGRITEVEMAALAKRVEMRGKMKDLSEKEDSGEPAKN
ncbi:EF-hand domain-containing protein [Stappia albiluteola]|nr:calcium-binding protein [Stappia albiluteola]